MHTLKKSHAQHSKDLMQAIHNEPMQLKKAIQKRQILSNLYLRRLNLKLGLIVLFRYQKVCDVFR